jgi:hypothetical protein
MFITLFLIRIGLLFEVENNDLAKKNTSKLALFCCKHRMNCSVPYFVLFFRLAMFLTLSFPFFGTAKVYKVL